MTLTWQDRRVLLTGGTGLLGGWLAAELVCRGADVVCIVRDWVPDSYLLRDLIGAVRIVRGDVRDQRTVVRALGEYEVETVFHLAAQTIVPIAKDLPTETLDVNVRGTWSVLDACRRISSVGQIVVASSDKAYDERSQLPFLEEAPLRGRGPYEVSKSCADLVAQMYATHYGLPVVVTRCGNLFGGGDLNWNRLIPGTIRSLYRGFRPVVRSDGSPIRDYIFVEDAVSGYLCAAEALAERRELAGEAFNFSYGRPQTVLAVVGMTCSLMESDLQPEVVGGAGDEIQSQYLDPSKARHVLGWSPSWELEGGLRRTIEWYVDFLSKTR